MHRALDNLPDATPPFEWLVGRICEEFNCLPSAAICELETEPQRLAETIMLLRSYASLKDGVDRRIAGQQVDLPDGPLLRLVLKHVEQSVAEKVKL